MTAHDIPSLPPGPPPAVDAALREILTGKELEAFGAVFAVRATAHLMGNAITAWMADSAASPARFQVLMQLWAAKGRGVPQKEIVAALRVTKPTVSGLIAGLERDGLVTSEASAQDRRNQLAKLTPLGQQTVERALESNKARLRGAFANFSSEEIAGLVALMQRLRAGFEAQ